jgi:hypothetical protein
MTFLPYHCPVHGTDSLLEPCKTNLARVKALKIAQKHIGPLERCLECGGKKLETTAMPQTLGESHKLGKKEPKEEEIAPVIEITENEAIKMGIVPPPDAQEVRYCKTHPEVPQKMDKLGRWMGMCAACVSIRGKKCGVQNFERGVTAPPMFIPLNLPKYAGLKNWIVSQADDEDRTLQMQIIYILKQAWKQGT